MPNILLLGYDPRQPSYRHRMQSLVPAIEAAGWQVRTLRLPSGRYGVRLLERRALLRWADVTVLHQIKLSAIEARLFAAFGRRRIFDLDDAIYVRKPRRLGEPPDDSRWRRAKFAATCRLADAVAAGNEVLAAAARPHRSRIAVLPTSIDVASYAPGRAARAEPPAIVWIGSPENLVYLELVRPALARLAVRHPGVRLRVICSHFPAWPEVPIERIEWSAAPEAAALAEAHIGIMPLTDDAWSRGKCAFKLLQYMAAALPCVASPVGANREAVIEEVTGFHATTAQEWEVALERLIESPGLRARLGAAGHAHVSARYDLERYRHDYLELLRSLLSDG
jgi:glycosyltransferase involved in cell wall biosynthesis